MAQPLPVPSGVRTVIEKSASVVRSRRLDCPPPALATRTSTGPHCFSTAANAFFGTNRFDILTLTITDDNFNLDVPNDTLRLPGGDLAIVSVGPTFTVQRWRENFYKLEGE